MGLIQTIPLWFQKGASLDSDDSPIWSPWYNLEALNGCQLFLQYSGVSNVGVDIEVSPLRAQGETVSGTLVLPTSVYETFDALADGANGSAGFFDPPTVLDRPIKSARFGLSLSADITACYFALLGNGLGGG